MNQSKLYQTLKTLNPIELNRFEKFVGSPYFNVNKDIKQLFAIIKAAITSKKKKPIEWSKISVWEEIYGSKTYNDKTYRKLNSLLLNLLQRFHAQEEYESNPLHKANYLLKAVRKKKLEALYNSSFSYARKLSNKQYERPPSYYFYLFQLEKSFLQLTSAYDKQKKARKTKKEDPYDVETQSHYLDLYYIAEKLRHLCFVLSRNKIYRKKNELLFIDEILEKIDQIDIDNYPPIVVYYQIYLSISDPDNLDHYYKLKELVFEHIDKFPADIVSEIYDATLNYCVFKINQGIEFNEELLKMYLFGLEKGYILKDGMLSPTSFRNICTVGFKLGNTEWVYQFIEDYQDFLSDKEKQNAVTYNLGRYYFHKKEYKKVIEKLRDVTYDDYLYELISKSNLIMTYYEMREFDTLEAFLRSFRTFISRHKKIPEHRAIKFINFIKIVQKMIYIIPGNNNDIDELTQRIETNTPIVNKKWVIQKLEHLR